MWGSWMINQRSGKATLFTVGVPHSTALKSLKGLLTGPYIGKLVSPLWQRYSHVGVWWEHGVDKIYLIIKVWVWFKTPTNKAPKQNKGLDPYTTLHLAPAFGTKIYYSPSPLKVSHVASYDTFSRPLRSRPAFLGFVDVLFTLRNYEFGDMGIVDYS